MVTTGNVLLAQLIAKLNMKGLYLSDPMSCYHVIGMDSACFKIADRNDNELSCIIGDWGEDGYRVFVHIDRVSTEAEAEEIARLFAAF